jgi:hypothetical protein
VPRPPRVPGGKATAQILIRLTAEEKALITSFATDAGKTPGAWMRDLALAEVRRAKGDA